MNDSIAKTKLFLNLNMVNCQDFVFNEQLDRSLLEEFYGKNIDEAYLMFSMFLKTTAKEFLTIIEFASTENFITIKRKFHKMKPNFKMVGLTLFYDKFSLLESQLSAPSLKLTLLENLEKLKTLFKAYYLPIIKLEIGRIEYCLGLIKK